MNGRVCVVVVTFNSQSVLEACLDRVYAMKDVDLIVVDNASTDDTCRLVEDLYPNVTLVRNVSNEGFARAVNHGVSFSTSKHILLVNPDVVVEESVVESLLDLMMGDASIGVAAPVVVERPGDRVLPCGYEPSTIRMFYHMTGLSRLGRSLPSVRGHYLLDNQLQGASDVEWTTGACFMTSIDVWRAAGGLSERWFMYAEDIDFCLRVGDLGYRVVVDESVRVSHSAGMSSAGSDNRVGVLWLENLYDLYCVRFGPGKARRLLWRFIVGSGFFARAAVARSPYNRRRFSAYGKCMLVRTNSTTVN